MQEQDQKQVGQQVWQLPGLPTEHVLSASFKVSVRVQPTQTFSCNASSSPLHLLVMDFRMEFLLLPSALGQS